MPEPKALGDLELAALVSSRVCQDVINPVSAISNGLEMLAEEPDEAMREAAMDLIRKSAAQASAKLQFARLAFGAAALPRGGMVNVEIEGTPPEVSFIVKAKGDSARLNDHVKGLLSGANGVAVDAHLVQPYYASRVATAAGM